MIFVDEYRQIVASKLLNIFLYDVLSLFISFRTRFDLKYGIKYGIIEINMQWK